MNILKVNNREYSQIIQIILKMKTKNKIYNQIENLEREHELREKELMEIVNSNHLNWSRIAELANQATILMNQVMILKDCLKK